MKLHNNFFSGERPRVAKNLSKDYEAQIAENCDLSRGDLRPFKATTRYLNLTDTGTLKTLYKWKKSGDDEWIVSANELDFARSPIAGEAHDRVYVTGMTEPRVLTNSILSSPFDFTTDYYKLGVPAPAAALTIDSGYTTGSDYRAYIYTYVVKLGVIDAEEGQNSAIAEITDYESGNVTLSGFTAPPATHSIGKIRIYRTAGSTSGVGEFLFVGEFDTAGVDFATYEFTDNVADSALGEAFACEDWAPPPSTLSGIIAPDGGSLAGFVGNRVYVSEPFLPHAWPYSYPVDSTIVGLGNIGNTIVVLTDETPYFLQGQADSLSTTKVTGRYPCVSKAGIVSCEIGVLYPSDEGIVLVTLDGPKLFSYDYFTQKQYYNDYSPTAIRAVFYNGYYFAFHNNGCFMINTRDMSLCRITTYPNAAAPHVSLADSRLYYISQDLEGANAIYKFEGETDSYQQYRWRSKEFMFGTVLNLSAARVIRDLSEYGAENADLIADADAVGAVVNEDPLNESAVNADGSFKTYLGVTFRFYGDGQLLLEKTIEDDEAFRLPGSNVYRRCYYEVSGDIPVCDVTIAPSMEELDAAA
jgi:hypothetical protein